MKHSLPFFQLRCLLKLRQFEAMRLHRIGPSGVSLALFPRIQPLSRFLLSMARGRRLWRQAKRGRKRVGSSEFKTQQNRHGRSRVLLCSKKIASHAERQEGAFSEDDGQFVGLEPGMAPS